jgi:hypothetical protein
MFKCQISGKNSLPKEKPVKLVTQTRDVVYYKKYKDKETGDLVLAIGKDGNPIIEGYGTEIVEEKLVLASVAQGLKNV